MIVRGPVAMVTGVFLVAVLTACSPGGPIPEDPVSPSPTSQEDTVTVEQTQARSNQIADEVQALVPSDLVTSVEIVDDSAGSLLGGDEDADASVVEWHVQRTLALEEPAAQLRVTDEAVEVLITSGWEIVHDGETTGQGGRWVELTRDADEGYQVRLQAGDDGSVPAVISIAVTGPTIDAAAR